MPNVFAKISGLDCHADNWSAVDIAPYIERALELFGSERLMFGSDWPVANIRGGYGKVWRETNLTLAHLSRNERDRILGGTAICRSCHRRHEDALRINSAYDATTMDCGRSRC